MTPYSGDMEARMRAVERYIASHEAEAKGALQESQRRMTRVEDSQGEFEKQLATLFRMVDNLKVKVALVIGIAGSVGGLVASLVQTLITRAIGH